MMVRITKRNLRQARAVSARGSTPRPPARGGLRAIAAATGLAVMVSLSPELTQAPTRADEPGSVLGGAVTPASQPVSPIVGGSPRVEPDLPPSRPGRVVEAPSAARPTASASASIQFQAALDAARIGAGTYGATFSVVRDGQVVWAGSSGVERDGLSPLTADSEMVIGSVTKTFVSATVLELVDEGRLSLDDSVRQIPARCEPGQPRDHDPPAPRPHQRTGGRLQRRDATRAGRASGAGVVHAAAAGEPPRAVVPAGGGLGIRQHELLPARDDRRAPDRVDPRAGGPAKVPRSARPRLDTHAQSGRSEQPARAGLGHDLLGIRRDDLVRGRPRALGRCALRR